MLGYGRHGGSVREGFRTFKYVDLTAFFKWAGLGTAPARVLAATFALPALVGLFAIWSRSPDRSSERLALALAVTVCWTPVVNLYGPIYDVSLAAPALLLVADRLRQDGLEEWPAGFRASLALLWVTGWLPPFRVFGVGVQPLTVGLVVAGTYALRLALAEPRRAA
jgi:hypothetical protein